MEGSAFHEPQESLRPDDLQRLAGDDVCRLRRNVAERTLAHASEAAPGWLGSHA
jgi:hypothetical protein